MNDPPTAPSRAAADTRSLAAFAALALIWGYNWVVMKIALVYTGPIHFAYLRVGLGGLLLFALLVALRAPLAPRHVGKTALVGLCQTTGFVGLISLALVYGETGRSAVLAYTMPFWVIALGWPFLRERLHGADAVVTGIRLPPRTHGPATLLRGRHRSYRQ